MHVIDCMRIGGAQRRLFQLFKGLQTKENIQNHLVIFSDEIDFPGLQDLNVQVFVIPSEKLISYKSFIEFRKIVKTIKPDVIHSWQLIVSFYASLLSFGRKFRHLNAMINDSTERGFFNKERLLAKAIIPFAHILVSNSKAGFAAYKVKVNKKCFVVYNGFDFERLTKKEQTFIEPVFKTENEPCTIIGMVARFENAKDYSTVIRAICMLLDRGIEVKFVAVGDGNTTEYCKNLVPHRYKNSFYFLGKRHDIDSLVPLFDIGVLSTFNEGISNSVMEYMAFKKPVVATDCPGNREIIVDKYTGLLAKARDKDDWANKLTLLIHRKDLQRSYGLNGFQRLNEQFALRKMIQQYTNLYNLLTEESIYYTQDELVIDDNS